MRYLVLILVLLVGGGCDKPSPNEIIYVEKIDPEMNAAMEVARSSVDQFLKAKDLQGAGFYGLLKVYFKDEDSPDEGEHMWVSVTHVDKPKFTGVLISEPGHLKSVSGGQQVKFVLSDISDWLYVENGIAQGAYSVQLLRSRMNKEERDAHDAGYPFTFE